MRRHDEVLLWEYVKDELPPEESALLEHHFEECPDCVEKLLEIRTAAQLLDDARNAKPRLDWAKVDAGLSKVIDQKIAAQARGFRWVGNFAGAMAVVAAVAVAAWFVWPRPSPSPLPPQLAVQLPVEEPHPVGSHIENADGLSKVGDQDVAVREGDPILPGDVLRTSNSGHGFIHLADESRVRLSAHSELAMMHASSSDISMNLERGQVRVHASHNKRAGFTVRANGVAVRVIGTVFEVSNSGAEVEIAVGEGRVQVEPPGGQPFFVDGGQHVRISNTGKPVEGKLNAAEKKDLAELLAADTDERLPTPKPTSNVPARGGNLPRLAKNDPRTQTHELQVGGNEPTSRDEVPLQGGTHTTEVVDPNGAPVPMQASNDEAVPAERPTNRVDDRRVLQVLPYRAPTPIEQAVVTGTDPATEWNAPPLQQAQPQAEVQPQPEAKAQPQPERQAPPPAAESESPVQRPAGADDAEGAVLRHASKVISSGRGDCRRLIPGLDEILEHHKHDDRTERARILRARCYDSVLEAPSAEQEYRRYLHDFPDGSFATEARRWLDLPTK